MSMNPSKRKIEHLLLQDDTSLHRTRLLRPFHQQDLPDSTTHAQPFPKRQILDSSKLKGFADDNFKFNENCRKLPNR